MLKSRTDFSLNKKEKEKKKENIKGLTKSFKTFFQTSYKQAFGSNYDWSAADDAALLDLPQNMSLEALKAKTLQFLNYSHDIDKTVSSLVEYLNRPNLSVNSSKLGGSGRDSKPSFGVVKGNSQKTNINKAIKSKPIVREIPVKELLATE